MASPTRKVVTRLPNLINVKHASACLLLDQMADLPLDPVLARMLLAAGEIGCTKEVVTVVAMLRCVSAELSRLGMLA